jgi:hypothetical protein
MLHSVAPGRREEAGARKAGIKKKRVSQKKEELVQYSRRLS